MDENRMFDQQVHDAYEQVSLSDEAQERMLAALLVAQAERQDESTETGPASAAPQVTADADPAEARKAFRVLAGRRMPVWLPLAAAVACAFVVVGVVGGRASISRTSVPMEAAEVAASDKIEDEDKALYATSAREPDADAAYVTNDLAADAVGEAEMPTAVPEVTEEAAEPQLVDLYPHITLYDETSYTALVDGMYTTEVEAETVGRLIGVGTASPFDADDTVDCEVFELTGEDAYAVRYEGEQTYWYCTRL